MTSTTSPAPSPLLIAVLATLTGLASACADAPADFTPDAADVGTDADVEPPPISDVEGSDSDDGELDVTDNDGLADSDTADSAEPEQESVPAVACILDPECDTVIVVAHRGMHRDPWASIPENSLASIRVAGEVGVPMVELDVRHTADGVLVVMHDGDLDRTTDGTGNVDAMTWESLQQLRLDGGTEDVPDTLRIPTFAQALEQARVSGVDLYVDVKSDRIAQMVQAIVDADMVEHVLFREDEGGALLAYQLEPALPLLIPVDTSEQANALLQQIPELRAVEVVSPIVQPELTAQLNELGLVVQQDVFVSGDTLWFAGGGNDGWLEYVAAGVRILQTDYPTQLQQVLADR